MGSLEVFFTVLTPALSIVGFFVVLVAVIRFFVNLVSSKREFTVTLSMQKYFYTFLKADAKRNGRSFSKQITYLLESYYGNQAAQLLQAMKNTTPDFTVQNQTPQQAQTSQNTMPRLDKDPFGR